jgi:hypothetical protein
MLSSFRRPWAGKEAQRSYPCTATIHKMFTPFLRLLKAGGLGTGERVAIDMRGKRSMKIYKEILSILMRAVDVKEEYKMGEKNAEIIAKPYSKWV